MALNEPIRSSPLRQSPHQVIDLNREEIPFFAFEAWTLMCNNKIGIFASPLPVSVDKIYTFVTV
jgi:hypothetical protein